MSFFKCDEHNEAELKAPNCDPVSRVIIPRTGDIGGFSVHRALPFRDQRMVGPFIFWDQMGPGEFISGKGVDVRPHPHIGLSTVTYLFEGTLDHKDSLGSDVRIAPGDINLMRAGHGIVHSERTGQDIRQSSSTLFGIQSWLALPKSLETTDPTFTHTTKQSLPRFHDNGVTGRIIMGSFEGLSSPVHQDWDTLYIDAFLEDGAKLQLPAQVEERAIFAIEGTYTVDGTSFPSTQMIVLKPGRSVIIKAQTATRLMILGGAAMDGPRFIEWNFVGSSQAMIDDAKSRWRNHKFPKVPGDSNEWIPLP